jgi:hypothetical protein
MITLILSQDKHKQSYTCQPSLYPQRDYQVALIQGSMPISHALQVSGTDHALDLLMVRSPPQSLLLVELGSENTGTFLPTDRVIHVRK